MYPLKIVLVGCREADQLDLRHELAEQGAVVQAQFPDAKAAIAGLFPPHESKRLFIYQITTDDLRQLERLNDSFVGRPILALVSSATDTRLVLRAMRAGAAQVVALPIQPEDLRSALDRIARQFGYPSSESKVIAVTGVSEGCGATTIAINLAAEVAQSFKVPCILAELSLRLGRLAVYLDLEPRVTTRDLLTDMDRLDIDVVRQALIPASENLRVLAGPHKGIATEPTTPQNVIRVIDYLRRLAPVVVLDMPYTFDELYFKIISIADEVVLVGQQNVPSVQALKTVRDTLQKSEGTTIYPVINRYNNRLNDFTAKHIQDLLQIPKVFTIANDHSSVTMAENEGRTLRQRSPGSRTLVNIDELVAALLGVPEMPRKNSFLQCLFRALATANG